MIHQIAWDEGLLTSGVFGLEVSYQVILELVEGLERLLVVFEIAGPADDFKNVEVQGKDFLGDDDFGLLGCDFLMIHVTQDLATYLHVNLWHSLFYGHDEPLEVPITLLVHILELLVEGGQERGLAQFFLLEFLGFTVRGWGGWVVNWEFVIISEARGTDCLFEGFGIVASHRWMFGLNYKDLKVIRRILEWFNYFGWFVIWRIVQQWIDCDKIICYLVRIA